MQMTVSAPRNEVEQRLPGTVNPHETVSQFILLAIVIFLCFYQPPFLTDMILQSFQQIP